MIEKELKSVLERQPTSLQQVQVLFYCICESTTGNSCNYWQLSQQVSQDLTTRVSNCRLFSLQLKQNRLHEKLDRKADLISNEF